MEGISKSVIHKTKNKGNLHVSTGLEDTPFSKGVNMGKYSKWELCILWKIWVLGGVKLTSRGCHEKK